MSGIYIDLADVDTTREVIARRAPRGVRNLILIAAAVLVAAVIALGFMPVQQTLTLNALVVAEVQPRVVTSSQAGVVSQVGAADGETVSAGQVVLALDSTDAQSQLTVLQQEEDSNTSDITNYQQLRQAAGGTTNPFDATTQPAFFYSLEQYWQNLAQAGDTVQQNKQTQSSTRSQAQTVLGQNQTALSSITSRINELNRLVSSIRSGASYSSSDSYAQALYQSWQAGRPSPGDGSGQSVSDYDTTFITQVMSTIADLNSQQTSYSTEVASLQNQLAQPVIDPTADPKAAVTANFMLQATTAEEQLRQQNATLVLQAMDLQSQIDHATIKAPIDGVVDLTTDWRVGDQVQSGQELFRITPSDSGVAIDAAVPATAVASVSQGQDVPCTVPNDPAGKAVAIICQVSHVADTYDTTQSGQLVYQVRLTVEPGSDLRGYGSTLPAGLPVTLTVTTSQSSALHWLGVKTGLINSE